jgi:hypothetical protein
MALSLGSLAAYTEEHINGILSDAILAPKFTNYVTTWENVKSSIKLPELESTVPFQAGASCNSVTTSGTTTITQSTLSTVPIEFAEKLCLNDLEAYFTQKYLPAGANKPDQAAIMGDIVKRKMARIALQIEQLFFQGKTTYGNSTVLKQANGLISLVDTAGTAIAATPSTFNTTNAISIMNEIVYQKIPTAIMDQSPIIAIGWDNFRVYLQALQQANAFNYFVNAADLAKGEVTVPGTNTKVVAFAGLNADTSVDTGVLPTAVKNRILVFSKPNVNYGVDLSSDSTSTDVWMEKKERSVYIYGRFRFGVVARRYTEMVQYTNS